MFKFKPIFAALAISTSLLAFSGCATSQSPSASVASLPPSVLPDRIAAMRTVLQDGVDKKVTGGFSAALVDSYGRIETTYVGLADIETGKPVTPDTVFRIYSMTKPITAVAIMMLVEEGKIDLDAPVATYIPSFAKTVVYVSGDTLETLKTEPAVRPLTVRDLMRQSAGIPWWGPTKPVERLYAMNGIERAPGEVVPGFKGPRVANLQDLADRVAATAFTNQPGETWTYGIAIDVLGRVVEVASGQSLGTFFNERIFTPLGMKHTAFQVQPGGQENLANVYFAVSKVKPATGGIDSYVKSLKDVPMHEALRPADPPAKSPFQAPARIEFGGAGLVGTLNDYVRFARMIAGQGELDGVRILKAASIAEMGKDQLGPKANANLIKQGYSYGLGFGTVLDSNLYPTGAPVGTMFWGGAAGTQFWANPQTKEAGVLMTQVLGDYLRTYQVNAARAANGLPVQ